MSAVSTGILSITPKTATTPQSAPQQQANDRDSTAAPVEAKQTRPPPPPGQGKFVDKYA
jgi:hypothetical protein